MKKPKSIKARTAEAKRGKKRSDRLKTTKVEKGPKKLKLALKKKHEAKKQQEMFNKFLQERAELA